MYHRFLATWNRSLNRLFLMMTGTLLLVIVLIIGATLWVVDQQKADGLVVNLSGRQRMLTQKFTKEVLYETSRTNAAPADAESAADLPSSKTRELFEITLLALTDGGTTYTDLGMTSPVDVSATENPAIRNALAEVAGLWDQLQRAADGLRTEPADSAAHETHLEELWQLNIECLKSMNAAVGMYQRESEAKVANLQWIQYTLGGVALIVFGLISLYIRRKVVRPLSTALKVANAVASGDLTHACPVTTKHEVGQLSDALNTMCADLKRMVGTLIENAHGLKDSASQLGTTATQLNTGANETTQQSATVAAAVEEMSTNMVNVAASTKQMSNNVQTVSASIGEMTAAIGEVARSAEQAANVADNASRLAETSNTEIAQLSNAADEIGKVIEVIQDIAEQTNLLALNATIEAARAGEAGKGFAVVATEVKELAKQTGDATEDIRRRIEGIQDSTTQAVASINEIAQEVGKVNEASRTIAAAVEQQSATTNEIARNVAQAASGTEEVSVGVGETADATREVTESISKVDQNAKRTCHDAGKTQTASNELNEVAQHLQSLVEQFKV